VLVAKSPEWLSTKRDNYFRMDCFYLALEIQPGPLELSTRLFTVVKVFELVTWRPRVHYVGNVALIIVNADMAKHLTKHATGSSNERLTLTFFLFARSLAY